MREFGPTRLFVEGDPNTAKRYIGAARVMLGQLRNRMDAFGTEFLRQRKVLPNGWLIEVCWHYGQSWIRLVAPGTVADKLILPTEQGFIFTPRTLEHSGGWGPPVTEENKPLGTPGEHDPVIYSNVRQHELHRYPSWTDAWGTAGSSHSVQVDADNGKPEVVVSWNSFTAYSIGEAIYTGTGAHAIQYAYIVTEDVDAGTYYLVAVRQDSNLEIKVDKQKLIKERREDGILRFYTYPGSSPETVSTFDNGPDYGVVVGTAFWQPTGNAIGFLSPVGDFSLTSGATSFAGSYLSVPQLPRGDPGSGTYRTSFTLTVETEIEDGELAVNASHAAHTVRDLSYTDSKSFAYAVSWTAHFAYSEPGPECGTSRCKIWHMTTARAGVSYGHTWPDYEWYAVGGRTLSLREHRSGVTEWNSTKDENEDYFLGHIRGEGTRIRRVVDSETGKTFLYSYDVSNSHTLSETFTNGSFRDSRFSWSLDALYFSPTVPGVYLAKVTASTSADTEIGEAPAIITSMKLALTDPENFQPKTNVHSCFDTSPYAGNSINITGFVRIDGDGMTLIGVDDFHVNVSRREPFGNGCSVGEWPVGESSSGTDQVSLTIWREGVAYVDPYTTLLLPEMAPFPVNPEHWPRFVDETFIDHVWPDDVTAFEDITWPPWPTEAGTVEAILDPDPDLRRYLHLSKAGKNKQIQAMLGIPADETQLSCTNLSLI